MAKAVLVLKVVPMVKVVPVLMVEVFLAVKMILMGVVEELWLPGKAILVEPLMVETPRMRSWRPPPGAPELLWMLTPATLPCSA